MKKITLLIITIVCFASLGHAQSTRPPGPRRVATKPATPCKARDFIQADDTKITSICANGLWVDWNTSGGSSGGGGDSGSQRFSGVLTGGIVVWMSAYTFRVSAAQYMIQGTVYESAEQTITLDAADGALDRIDVLALNISGTFVKITGTAAAQPSEPDFDPSTQLKLTFVFVAAASTSPAGVSNESIYLENTEWTSSTSGSGWNANSTSNPRTGTKDIEGTSVANGAYVQLQRGSTTALDTFGTLSLFIRSKATWNNNRVLRLQFFNAGVAKGTAITVADGYWGFDSSITGSYQLVAIPVTQFAVSAGTLVNQLRITNTGGSIGLYVDDVVLQVLGTTVAPPAANGITFTQADARYAQRANNLSDLNSAATARTNLGATAVGGNLFTATNPSAITFPKVAADNTVSFRTTAQVLSDIGAAASTHFHPIWMPAAGCNNATASSFWDLFTSNQPTPTCVTGTNTQKAYLDYPDSDGDYQAQTTLKIPTGATGFDLVIHWLTTTTTGDAFFQVATACVADGETDDPSWNTASTVADTAKGTTNQLNTASITTLVFTGCGPDELLHLRVLRNRTNGSDTLGAAAVRLYGVQVLFK